MISKNLTRPLSLLAFEGALVYSCGVLAIYMRFGAEATDALGVEGGWLKTLLATVPVLTSFYLFDLYDLSRVQSRGALLLRLSQSLAVGGLALALMFYAWPQLLPGRGVFPLSLVLTSAFMVAWRSLARRLLDDPRLAHRVLILITTDWEKTNERRAQLIQKKIKRTISADEKRELDHLQQLADARLQLLSPLPIKELELLRETLKQRGAGEG